MTWTRERRESPCTACNGRGTVRFCRWKQNYHSDPKESDPCACWRYWCGECRGEGTARAQAIEATAAGLRRVAEGTMARG